jgi:16S rRNA (guanine966-N2)-methyltransferase
MRIVGGEFKGRTLVAPDGLVTRPTSDRAREAVFNILNHAPWCPNLSGMQVMDVFAGSGALGLEALSHGAAHCYFVDNSHAAQKAISENIKKLSLGARATLFARDATAFGPRPVPMAKCDLIFMDPPYHKGLDVQALMCLDAGNWLTDEAIIVLERAKGEHHFATVVWEIIHTKSYGIAEVLFLRKKFITN